MTSKFRQHEIGSTVMYAKRFLRSICAGPTDPLWRAKGIVTGLQDVNGEPWPLVLMDGEPEPRLFHPNNVASGLAAHID